VGFVAVDIVGVVTVEAPGTTGGEVSTRAVSICGVTTGFGGISCGLTVLVAIVG
jgi:glycine cleavage system pyridoxal-binding protein P